jgi:uncharacterized protein
MSASNTTDEHLKHVVEHIAHLLPAQGPIGVFIHHNTLHAFQHLPFERAVVEAARRFGAEPYMKEDAYRDCFAKGRIRKEDVEAILEGEGQQVALRKAMMVPGVRRFEAETIRWEIEEKGLKGQFRKDLSNEAKRTLAFEVAGELFDFWFERTGNIASTGLLAARPREGVLAATGVDVDETIHPLLIRLTAAFLDQGMAYWPMPNREEGFWSASLRILGQPASIHSEKLSELPRWVEAMKGKTGVEAAIELLNVLGVDGSDWETMLEAEVLAMPGWAGLMHQLEKDPSLAPHEVLPATLMDFIAVRLLLTVAGVATAMGEPKRWRIAIESGQDQEAERLLQAARLFDASQLMGLGAEKLEKWPQAEVERLRSDVLSFDELERRRIWHLAYERRHERQILVPLRKHAAQAMPETSRRLVAQVFFCIDDREESIRRHLEEVDGEIETFGAAGFFGVAMNYAGIDDAGGASLCPVVVKPQHAVTEQPMAGQEKSHGKRKALRKIWSRLVREMFVSSRTLVRGWIGTTVLGIFSLFPLVMRVLSPRQYGRLVAWLNDSVLPEPRTELAFMRQDATSHQAAHGLLEGFTVEEKVERVASVLGPAGLRKGMARLVIVLGHGSTSLNNPHESAYNCGACGGRQGGPNARIFAAMANHPEVRRGLRERNIVIPEDTWFVGGYHDTCSDDIDLYDIASMPESHACDLDRVRQSLEAARTRSAHERTRRFDSAGKSKSFADGLRHVQERAEHLAEPRPEYGHSTNAICFVGKRKTTRGLFLDRRAFLVSYDATQDPDNASLGLILGAVIPVCGGINLEYFFSSVDNEGYGCGTKLPHNITGLVGVMNGYESDLRTGLTLQMVEIHEPVRILFIVETTKERVLETIRQNALLREFLDNQWIRLAVQDPIEGSKILAYRGGEEWEAIEGEDEVLGVAETSLEWYHGKREHLPLARIEPKSVLESTFEMAGS